MDFAEFSDIETMGFATYRQKLQEQFSEDIKTEMIEAHGNSIISVLGFASIAKECIPGVSNVVNIGSRLIDARRLDKKELPNLVYKDILSRISEKFNQTLDHVGNYVNVIQGKLTVSQKEIETLTAELNQMKETFLSDEMPVANKDLEIRRLKHKMTILTTQNKILTNSVKNLKEEQRQRFLSDERAKKAKVVDRSAKIDELHEIIDQLNRRNKQLGERLNEKPNNDDIYTLTHASVWVGDKIAHTLGLKDVVTFVKNFTIIAEAAFKGLVVLGYAYTLFNTTDSYIYWLKNAWKGPMNKVYAISVVPVILFCMIKLAGF
jgi:hypothetical protein